MSQAKVTLRSRFINGRRYHYSWVGSEYVNLGPSRSCALERLRGMVRCELLEEIRRAAHSYLGRSGAADLLRKIESELAGEVIVSEACPLNRAKPRWFTAMFSSLMGLRNGVEEDELRRIAVILRLLPDRLPTREAIATIRPELRLLAEKLRIASASHLLDRAAWLRDLAQKPILIDKPPAAEFDVVTNETALVEASLTLHLAWQLAPELPQVREQCRDLAAQGSTMRILATYDRKGVFLGLKHLAPTSIRDLIALLRRQYNDLDEQPQRIYRKRRNLSHHQNDNQTGFNDGILLLGGTRVLILLPDMTEWISAILSTLDVWRTSSLYPQASATFARQALHPEIEPSGATPPLAVPASPTLGQTFDLFMEGKGKTLALKSKSGYAEAFKRLLREFRRDDPVSAVSADRLLKLRNTLCQDDVKRGGCVHTGITSRTLQRTADEIARMFQYCLKLRPHPALAEAVTCIGQIDWVNAARPPMHGKPSEKGLADSQLQKLFAIVRNDPEASERNHALLAFMAYQGTRLNETARLRWKDVAFDSDFVLVHGKGKLGKRVEEERVLSPDAKNVLLAWKDCTPEAKPNDTIFGLSKDGVVSLKIDSNNPELAAHWEFVDEVYEAVSNPKEYMKKIQDK